MKQESQDKKEKFEREKVKVYGPMRFIKGHKIFLRWIILCISL